MIYKGNKIEDRIYVKREMIFKELSYNCGDFWNFRTLERNGYKII